MAGISEAVSSKPRSGIFLAEGIGIGFARTGIDLPDGKINLSLFPP
jgi:hypothetical protein